MRIAKRVGNTVEKTSFGAIHLKITDLSKASFFWTKIAGLKLRSSDDNTLSFGSEKKTLVVVHNSAKRKYLDGFSGLYHFAIHVPNEEEFASVINRLNERGYPYSPVDHTISKAVYLKDLEGITVEFTLETPGREQSNTGDGLRPRPLYVNQLLQKLENDDVDKVIDDGAFIGHIHLYANNLDESYEFYRKIGFTKNKYKPQMVFADLGSGGEFGHRIAMNSWHGMNRPLAPADSAGLEHFQLTYKDKTELYHVLDSLSDYQEKAEGYWIEDPTGNRILLN